MFANIKEELAYGIPTEIEIGKMFAQKFNCECVKSPAKEDFDFLMVRNGRITAFLEVKKRSFKMNNYDSTIVPMRKYVFAEAMARAGYPVFLAIQWEDFRGYMNMAEVPLKIDIVRRGDRSTHQIPYEGMHVFYPISKFKPF